MFVGWVASIANVRYPRIGPKRFDVVRLPSPCSAGELGPDLVKLPRGVVHETQTKTIPGYDGTAPNFTIGPRSSSGPWVIAQHVQAGYGSCSLRHPAGTPETNRVARVQVEVCGYTTRAKHLPVAPPEGIALLQSFFAWCEDSLDIPLVYPYDPGDMATGTWAVEHNPWRDASTWERKAGWHPHAAVDHNTHWDVGGLLVTELFPQTSPPVPTSDSFGVVELWRDATDDHRHLVEIVAPLPTLKAALSAANTRENRTRIRKALRTKGHIVRVVKRKVAA